MSRKIYFKLIFVLVFVLYALNKKHLTLSDWKLTHSIVYYKYTSQLKIPLF